MPEKFDLVKQYLFEMEIPIVSEDPAEELVVVDDEDNGIKNLVIDCEEPILVLEQIIMKAPHDSGNLFKRLWQMNRDLVHGAFVLDENYEKTSMERDEKINKALGFLPPEANNPYRFL